MDTNGKNTLINRILAGVILALISFMILTVQGVKADVVELKVAMGKVETKLDMLTREP